MKILSLLLNGVYAFCILLISCALPQAEEPSIPKSPEVAQQASVTPSEVVPAPTSNIPAVIAPKVSAAAAIVYDPRTGRVVYEKNALY